MMSAPARRIESSDSISTRGSSSHPRAPAAFTIAYSPDTLYAATGTPKRSFTRHTISR
jgi:hypothetical protein